MHQCIKFILFWNDILHVSDGTYCCLLASGYPLASRQQYLFGCCMYSLELLMMDGKTVRNM